MKEIYALKDPDTGEVRYIGKANCHKKRLKSHVRDSHRRSTPVCNWVAKLVMENKIPLIEVLAIVEDDQWEKEERRKKINCKI